MKLSNFFFNWLQLFYYRQCRLSLRPPPFPPPCILISLWTGCGTLDIFLIIIHIVKLPFFIRICQDTYLYILISSTHLKLFEIFTLKISRFWIKHSRDSIGFSVQKEVLSAAECFLTKSLYRKPCCLKCVFHIDTIFF